jgi:hypothetical protein
MVGMVMVDRGRTAVVAGAVGGVKAGAGVVVAGISGMVATGSDRAAVVGGASSTGSVVVVAEDDPPPDEPEDPDDEPEFDDSTEDTGAGVLPDRSGTLSGGVASGGLATVMNRLKICAGSEPPLTLTTPWTL